MDTLERNVSKERRRLLAIRCWEPVSCLEESRYSSLSGLNEIDFSVRKGRHFGLPVTDIGPPGEKRIGLLRQFKSGRVNLRVERRSRCPVQGGR